MGAAALLTKARGPNDDVLMLLRLAPKKGELTRAGLTLQLEHLEHLLVERICTLLDER